MFCGLRANCLESKVSSDKELCHIFLGYPCASRRSLKFARHSSNVVFEEFVLSSLTALLLIKPLFTPGGRHEVKWVNLSVKTCEVFLCFVAIVRVRVSLFQALCQCGRPKKWSGDERSLVEKEGAVGEPVFKPHAFRYTSSWYTLWLVTFDSLCQHLGCLSETKWRLTWRAWYTHVISRSQNLLKRSECSKEPVDRFQEKFAICFSFSLPDPARSWSRLSPAHLIDRRAQS